MAREVKKIAPSKTRNKVSRSEKIARRLSGISAKSDFRLKNAVFTVTASAKIPQSVQGYIVSRDTDNIVFRHKRTNASKRMVVSVIPTSDVLEVFGVEGEVAEITVLRDTIIRKEQGTVSYGNNSVTVKTVDGEMVTFYRNAGVTVTVTAEEDAPASNAPRKTVKGDKSAKGAKVVDIKSKSKAKKSKDYDDDGEL